MLNKKKVVVLILLIILWMGVIYAFSNMHSTESLGKSGHIINNIVDIGKYINDKNHIIDIQMNDRGRNLLIKLLQVPFRKIMHMSVYFILSCLLVYLFTYLKIENKKSYLFTFVICFIYACSDEYHQLFVGRTGQFRDVLIDTFGCLLALFIIFVNKNNEIKPVSKPKNKKQYKKVLKK